MSHSDVVLPERQFHGFDLGLPTKPCANRYRFAQCVDNGSVRAAFRHVLLELGVIGMGRR